MAEDNRDFIEQTLSRSRRFYGKEVTPDEMANDFARSDIHTRVDMLEHLEATTPEEMTPRELADRLGYYRALYGTHERLRKAGR